MGDKGKHVRLPSCEGLENHVVHGSIVVQLQFRGQEQKMVVENTGGGEEGEKGGRSGNGGKCRN